MCSAPGAMEFEKPTYLHMCGQGVGVAVREYGVVFATVLHWSVLLLRRFCNGRQLPKVTKDFQK